MTGTIRLIDDIEGFRKVARAWDECLLSMPEPSMFLSSCWLIAWWNAWSHDLRMHVLILEVDGEVLAGAAICFHETTYYGVPVREFKFIGDPASDRQEFIYKPPHEDAMQAIWSHLRIHPRGYDLVRLEEVPDISPTLSSARLECAGIETEPSSVLPYIPNLGRWEDFERGLASRFRSEMRTRGKHFDTWGRWSFDIIEGPAVAQHIDNIVSLELESARGTKGKTLFSEARNVEMIRNIVMGGGAEIVPILSILRLEDKNIAHVLCFKFQGKYHSYNTASLMEYGKGSPGKWVLHNTIRHAMESGMKEFDFLRGASYVKSRWRPQNRTNCRIVLFGRSRKAWALRRLVFTMRPWLKRINARTQGA